MTAFPVIDGHNDTLLRCRRDPDPVATFLNEGSDGHLDLPRALAGGLRGGFFAVFVPSPGGRPRFRTTATGWEAPLDPPVDPGYARTFADASIDLFAVLEAQSDGRFRAARTADAMEAGLARDGVSAILHFEGAEAIDDRRIDEDLDAWYARGLRSLGIVWSRPNAYGHGVPFRFPSPPDIGEGLTAAGRRLVKACNRRGILLDLAHLNAAGFRDVARLSSAPLVVTHACAHALCPTSRNLTDQQLAAIRASGGMVGVNFHTGDLDPAGPRDADTPLRTIVRHIDYLVDHLGIEGVGFGSDFDGARIPDDVGDVRGLPLLVDALHNHGYDDGALARLTHRNWLRILNLTWPS